MLGVEGVVGAEGITFRVSLEEIETGGEADSRMVSHEVKSRLDIRNVNLRESQKE